ncbi:conjugal transfer protein [Streptomyces sclerotialus]|uniref:conjugal transfer protein n=1 Tax=Streptomyces sclerotialus TaxID=1957 RepID=UPI0034A3A63E
MTDQNRPDGGFGGGQYAGQPASFGNQQQMPQQGQQNAQQGGQGYPQQLQQPSDAARAQVAAAWVRSAPKVGQAAVPDLPPRQTQQSGGKKSDKERARAARKAEYERKKAAREEKKARKKGITPAAPVTGRSAGAPHAASGHAGSKPSATGAASKSFQDAGAAADARGSAFDVPKPGGRIPPGRRTHVALRATALATTCLFALGSCGVMGLVVGKSGQRVAELSSGDVKRYGLTEFPTAEAAAFAERYAIECLTFSPRTSDQRRATLARFQSSGVDPDCGWSGAGSQKAVSATWDGSVEPLKEYGEHGRYFGVQVRLSTGQVTALTVPVYVKDLKSGQGLRIAGDAGQMPLPTEGTPPAVAEEAEIDEGLSAQLQSKVFPGYFEAWGASDATAMTRFTTPDASEAATSGLQGALEKPSVETVEAVVPPSAKGDDTYHYTTDQEVQARARVVWTDAQGGKVTRAYRVIVVNTEQGWFIKDVRGGVLDPEGGRADEDAPSGGAEQPATGDSQTDPSADPETQSGKNSRPPAHSKAKGDKKS